MPGLKRHPSLQDLSRDHQLFLLHARNLRWGVGGDPRAPSLAEALRGFVRFWQQEGILHVREEEEVLLPAYAQRVVLDGDEVTERVLADHAWLYAAAADLPTCLHDDAHRDLPAQVAQRVQDHVRFEERVWFERVQAALSEEELDRLGARSLAFRLQWRGLKLVGPLAVVCEL